MQTESKIQQTCVIAYRNKYCLKHHNPAHVIFSVPNESKSKQETIKKMAIRMLSGVSDVIIVRPNEVLFVEFKTGKGRMSESQKRFQTRVEALGFKYYLIRTFKNLKMNYYEKLPIQISPKGYKHQVTGVFRVPNTTQRNGKFETVEHVRLVDTGQRLWIHKDVDGRVKGKSLKPPEWI